MKEEELKTLIDLGLTDLEAKVYLALVHLGDSKATEICKTAKITRPDIYRVLKELADIGMVEKVLAKPLIFRATPLRSGTAFLLEQRDKKTQDLKTKIGKMVATNEKQKASFNLANDYRFIETPNRGSIIKEDVELNRIDWQTMDLVTVWGRFTRWVCINKYYINKVLDKGVKIRIIISCPQTSHTLIRKQCVACSKDLCKNSLFQSKYIFTNVPALISLYDNKAVRLVLKPAPFDCGGVGPDLYSDHPGLVGMARTYFDALWSIAEKLE